MTSAPQTTGSQLIEELNQTCGKDDVSPFEIARLNKKANALVKVAPVEGYTALGAIACFDFNIQLMKVNHQKALRISANDFFAMSNYVSSLGRTWLLSEQFDLLQKNIAFYPDYVLRQSVINRMILGAYHEAFEYAAEYLALPDTEPDNELKTIMETFELLNTFEVDLNDMKRYSEIMNNILSSHQISLGYITHHCTPEGELIRDSAVDKSVKTINKLNDELIEKLIEEKFTNNFVSHVSGRFIRCQ